MIQSRWLAFYQSKTEAETRSRLIDSVLVGAGHLLIADWKENSGKQEKKQVSQHNQKQLPRQEGMRITNYHHKDPHSSIVIYLGVGLRSWLCMAEVNGMCATPTLYNISHNLTSCALYRAPPGAQ